MPRRCLIQFLPTVLDLLRVETEGRRSRKPKPNLDPEEREGERESAREEPNHRS